MLKDLVEMSGNRRFVDTNILLYAHDDSAGAKRDRARALLEQLWDSREGCLSVQVLQEFFVNATHASSMESRYVSEVMDASHFS
jgi:predicted nucleic acid-binding protein